jgi:hypothetical protein
MTSLMVLIQLSEIYLILGVKGVSMVQYDPNIEQFPDHPCAVIYEGKVISYLNPNLIKKNGLSINEVAKIKSLHCSKYIVFQAMENTDDVTTLKYYAKIVEGIEYDLQGTWHFAKSSMMHRWFDVPKCKCPKLDNEERMGTKFRIFSADCPIHGK